MMGINNRRQAVGSAIIVILFLTQLGCGGMRSTPTVDERDATEFLGWGFSLVEPPGVSCSREVGQEDFETYTCQMAGKFVLEIYSGFAPQFPSAAPYGTKPEERVIDGLEARCLVWSEGAGRSGECLITVPKGLRYIHLQYRALEDREHRLAIALIDSVKSKP